MAVIINYNKKDVVQFLTVFWTVCPGCLSKGLLKKDFLDIYLSTFFLVRSSYFWKYVIYEGPFFFANVENFI